MLKNPVIVMTTYKGPEAFTAACLANLMATWATVPAGSGVTAAGSGRWKPSGPNARPLDFVLARGTDPCAQLYRAVYDLRKMGAPAETSGILSLEHDHGFEPQDLHDLLAVAESQPGAIVGGLYFQRQADKVVGEMLEPVTAWENEPTPAYLCKSVGLGFTFIPWSVFDEIPAPWFDQEWTRPGADSASADGNWIRSSHDEFFSREARSLGIPIVGVILRGLTHLHEVQPRGVKFKKEQA